MNTPGTIRALAIETSGQPGSIALEVTGRHVERTLGNARAHAADLFPTLRDLLDELGAGATPDALVGLERVIVGTGPGSFTGLRIGAAAARGISHATGATLVGVPSFAASALDAVEEGISCVLARDARAGRLYVARYTKTACGLVTLDAPRAIPTREFPQFLRGSERVFADDAVWRACDRTPPAEHRGPPPVPRASSLLELAKSEHAGDSLPLYLFDFGKAAG
ncbi:MAG TPA: tRNA (adenosine(37)-N6)-threonylcarbamoyltransferase complex dimerization subunit type 1 TsaB [Planctomycetes bacterium]|nr:tRNA (adenosine(37)-N6)-threonylcarbamoyltransferase complex dimerization subunit type 1 TsaB [Planctomycetota bacterium]